ncbi:MAG: hypothetical protein K8R54_06895 [Bacteroidales bacterium]|nr:hypothetical protein [Bacteroidales bacterium]
MLKIFLASVLLFFIGNLFGNLISEENNNFPISKETTIIYLNNKEANDYLLTTNYFNEQNKLSVSLKTKGEIEDGNIEYVKNEYQNFVASNLLNWKGNEKKYINNRFKKILPYIKKHTPKILSDTVFLIKSNKKIEFSSPFTKGKAIIIPKSLIPPFAMSWMIKEPVEHTFIHELFHIYSSNHIAEREKLYTLIGFEKIGNLEIPNNLLQRKIINPDDNISDYYKISLMDSTNNQHQDYIMLILSKYPKYEGHKGIISRLSIIMAYMEIRLAKITNKNNGWSVNKKDNKAELFNISDFPDFYKKIKFAHNYTLSPEEILAEDFAYLISTKMKKSKFDKLSDIEKEFFNNFELALK